MPRRKRGPSYYSYTPILSFLGPHADYRCLTTPGVLMGSRWNGKRTIYTDLRRAAINAMTPTKKKKKKGEKDAKAKPAGPSKP